jgi:hypothetical protein
VEKASEANYVLAKDVAARPDKIYEGQRITDFSPETTANWDWFNKIGINAGQAERSAATDTVSDLAKFEADRVKANVVNPMTAGGQDISPYLNPYIANVEDKALSNLDRSRTLALQGNAAKAQAAKSFGGSRSAIIDAVTNSETARQMGDLSANLRKAGWDSATGLLGQDVNRINAARDFNAQAKNQAALANQQAGLSSAGIRGSAADRLRGLATDQESDAFRDYALKADIGSQKQARSQALLDQAAADWQYKEDEPVRDLNLRLAALGMSPYGKTETSTKTTSGGDNPNRTDWATVGLGGMKLLGGLFSMFSDDSAKTDKEKVGELDNGLGVYAYRYKNDPKSYPKTVGLMASEVEKVKPQAVKRMPGKKGKKIVDYANAMGW